MKFTTRQRVTFTGAHGNEIVGDLYENPGAPTVLLAHGGGQTRHSWRNTAEVLASHGWTTVSIDQRGHGDSQWIREGDYMFDAYAADIAAVAEQIAERFGAQPVSIGASLGGITSMIAAGESDGRVLSGLVMVDVAPGVRQSGVEKIQGFMLAYAEEGFASLEEAADAIAEYLPHRERPKDLSGLSKNLRLREDGRYRWHWDPYMMRHRFRGERRAEIEKRLEAAARGLRIPTLLVRGTESELVDEDVARNFLKLVPHAKLAEVRQARHMVAGDENDAFKDTVVAFLDELQAEMQDHVARSA